MTEAHRLWTPAPEFIRDSNLTRWNAWLREQKNLNFQNYEEMWVWSTTHLSDFWTCLAEYFDVITEGTVKEVLSGSMPEVNWFEGVRLNYAEHVFKQYTEDRPAIIYQSEAQPLKEISWASLKQQVGSLQRFLIDAGVKEGDRVAGYLPCIPEATIAFLATNSIGAIWSSCSPDFGTQSVIDRFAQIEPKVFIAVDGYRYGGKYFDKADVVGDVINALPTFAQVLLIKTNTTHPAFQHVDWKEAVKENTALTFKRVPFNHPMWVLYSSGTTGLPKAILHSHGGILLEQLKYLTFHNDVKPGERFFWYTTTGWMMWNYIQGSLLCGATLALYDGSPAYPNLKCMWKFAADARIHHFGTSAAFILSNLKAGLSPKNEFELSALRSVSSTGSTLPPEGFEWIYQNLKNNLWLASMSGGTDVCSAFVGGNPWLAVYSGEIQCRALGCKLEALDENGLELHGEVGEMVIQQPMPSMPVMFWNDPGKKRYRESYFEVFPGQWRHGDWIEITERGGVVIYGRSDATLNRGGVRIGTSEIYRAVDKVKEVKDSLIVCLEKEKGDFYMPLFVVMAESIALTDEIRKKINSTIRQDYSPRHVPDEIISVPDIPYTISGKKTETPVKKVLMGKDPKQVVNAGALRNPEAIDFFVSFYNSTEKKA